MGKPRVLVVGINPWVDNTGINTLINFFSEWGTENLAHLYTRDALPCTAICDIFFRISEKKLMKSVFQRKIQTGERVLNTAIKTEPVKDSLYNHKHSSCMTLARECVWKFGRWKTPELNSFLDDFAPDVLFFPVYSTVYMNRLQNYIARYTKKPVILYSSDDNYSYASIEKTLFSLILRTWLRKQEKKLFLNASAVLVISPKQKEEYDKLFNIDCGILTKGIDFSQEKYENSTLHAPIKMVYTGKIIIGRGETLSLIAEALGEVNREKKRIVLEIYTTDSLTSKMSKLLNRNGCIVKGALTLDEVQTVQKDADILVFVESLEKRYRKRARLSFSTKITDYLKSGKCILAIGDSEIAPMDYFKRYDSALTASSYGEILTILKRIVADSNLVATYGKKAFECGKIHHDKNVQQDILTNYIYKVAKI